MEEDSNVKGLEDNLRYKSSPGKTSGQDEEVAEQEILLLPVQRECRKVLLRSHFPPTMPAEVEITMRALLSMSAEV